MTLDASPDEDLFTMPASWVRSLHPRRGGVKVAVKQPDADSPATVAATWESHRKVILACLALCPDPEIAAAGAAYLAGDPASTPLGAATVAEIVGAHLGWQETATLVAIAESWLVERGLVFAAMAVAELSSVKCGGDQSHYNHANPALPIRRLAAGDASGRWWGWYRVDLPRRVRAAVATSSDAEYAEVVAALARCREAGPHQRVAASYLVPTEADWVEADCAEVARLNGGLADGLLAATNTPEQAALIASQVQLYYVTHSLALPATIVDGMGAAAVPVLAGWLDDAYGADDQRRLLAVLAELPSDAACSV